MFHCVVAQPKPKDCRSLLESELLQFEESRSDEEISLFLAPDASLSWREWTGGPAGMIGEIGCFGTLNRGSGDVERNNVWSRGYMVASELPIRVIMTVSGLQTKL